MMMRYALAGGAAAVAVYGAVNLGANNANMVLVDAGMGGPGAELPVWVLAMFVAAMVLSFCREAASNLPAMTDGWDGINKLWLFAGAGMAVCAAYALI